MTSPYWIERSGLAVMPRPRGGDWLDDEIAHLKEGGVHTLVCLLTDSELDEFDLREEGAACRQAGIEFLRLPIPDRGTCPAISALPLVRELAGRLRGSRRVVIHCRQGIGRAGMMAAAVLAVRGESIEDAIKQVSRARGLEIPETKEQHDWVASVARLHLV